MSHTQSCNVKAPQCNRTGAETIAANYPFLVNRAGRRGLTKRTLRFGHHCGDTPVQMYNILHIDVMLLEIYSDWFNFMFIIIVHFLNCK